MLGSECIWGEVCRVAERLTEFADGERILGIGLKVWGLAFQSLVVLRNFRWMGSGLRLGSRLRI